MALRPALAATVLLLGAALAACGGGGGNRVATEGADTSTTTTAGAPGDDGAGSGSGVAAGEDSGTPGGAGGGQDGGTGTGGAEPQSPPPPAPQASGAAQPMAPGTYTYDTDGQATTEGALGNQTEELPSETTLVVEAADGGRQKSVRDTRDAEGEGGTTTTILQYRDDGVYLEYVKLETRVNGVPITYEFVPSNPQLIAPTGAGVGYHTEFTMTSTNNRLTVATTIDVTGEETLTVGGKSVETLKVRTHTTFEGDARGEATFNDNVDPARYLIVREDHVLDATTAFGDTHSEQVSTLRSLDPA